MPRTLEIGYLETLGARVRLWMPEIGAVVPPPSLRKQNANGDAIQFIKPTSKHAAVLRFPAMQV